MKVLVTGGTGYIGSHTVVELLQKGYEVVICDNLCNSKKIVLDRIYHLTGVRVPFYPTDITDKQGLTAIFKEHKIDGVINFAGLKAVGESNRIPLEYYHNNVTGMLVLLDVMRENECFNLVFSSSATVYGIPKTVPIKEDAPLSATNPYGRTKLYIEGILTDLARSDSRWNIALLRYFNPIGAHESGIMGEDPNGIPNNLAPYILKVIVGKLPILHVYGNDYPTPDGTGVRDYIHVCDLAAGHVCALKKLEKGSGLFAVNLGTGTGYSVLDIVNAFEKACGHPIPYVIEKRREGDVATCFADPAYAKELIGFTAKRGLDEMCADAYRWQVNNPDGYVE